MAKQTNEVIKDKLKDYKSAKSSGWP